MAQARRFRVIGLVVTALTLSLAMAAQGDTTAIQIQQKLYSQFKLTTIKADRSNIVTAGDVVVIHKPGLLMYGVGSPMPPSNNYKSGKIGQGWGKNMAITMAAPSGWTAANYPHRSFAPEEKCWITAIQVQQDGVLMQLYSDPYNGIRYYASLRIPFPTKNGVLSVDAAMESVAEVLTVVPGQQGTALASDATPNTTQDGKTMPIAGQYLSPAGPRILLLPDGSFTKVVGAWQGHGQYAVDGNDLKLTFTSTGISEQFKLQSGNLLDVNTNQVWARMKDAPVAHPAELPTGVLVPRPAAAPAPLPLAAPEPLAPATPAPPPPATPAPLPKAAPAPMPAATPAPLPKAAPAPTPAATPAPMPKAAPAPMPAATPAPMPKAAPAPLPAAAPAPLPKAPMPEIASPPPPADAPLPTITVGLTKDQVTAILGHPVKAAKIGAKDIYYYKDMKVIFIDGEVTDVE